MTLKKEGLDLENLSNEKTGGFQGEATHITLRGGLPREGRRKGN